MDDKKINLIEAAIKISHEKEIDRTELIEAIRTSVLQAAQRKYTNFDNIEVQLDQKAGKIYLRQYKEVVEEVEDSDNEINLKEAKKIDSTAEMGDEIAFPISQKEIQNTIAQATRQILLSKVRGIERDTVIKKFSSKIMDIVHGKVARIEPNRAYVILNSNIEGVLDKKEMLWNDHLQSGEVIRALLIDIKSEGRQHLPTLSRTHPDFLLKLLEAEIPEIFDSTVEVLKIARVPGRKSKVFVRSKDTDIDPVGACIGHRGSRISPIITELNGERIDILPWKENIAERISTSLNVEGIHSITVNEELRVAEIEIQAEFLPAAIGKGGQNVRLAQKITDYEIKFVNFSPENQRKELLTSLFKDNKSDSDATSDNVESDSENIESLKTDDVIPNAQNTEEQKSSAPENNDL